MSSSTSAGGNAAAAATQPVPNPPVFASAADTDPLRLGWMRGTPPEPDKQVRHEDNSHFGE